MRPEDRSYSRCVFLFAYFHFKELHKKKNPMIIIQHASTLQNKDKHWVNYIIRNVTGYTRHNMQNVLVHVPLFHQWIKVYYGFWMNLSPVIYFCSISKMSPPCKQRMWNPGSGKVVHRHIHLYVVVGGQRIKGKKVLLQRRHVRRKGRARDPISSTKCPKLNQRVPSCVISHTNTHDD